MRLFLSSIRNNNGNQPQPISGCTDPNADNYNPLATVDDGSCTYNNQGKFTFPTTFPTKFD